MPEKKAFLLRIDPALWADLEAWAANELRSINGQIEYLLRQAVAKRKRAGAEDEGTNVGENDKELGTAGEDSHGRT